MTKIQLYIASTIDGYIAREDGSLDWLHALPNPDHLDYGYADFIAGVDTVVMGRSTYEEILGFGVERPYGDCTTYVLTSRDDYVAQTPHTQIVHKLTDERIQQIRAHSTQNIRIVGGGKLITACLDHGAIDEMIISLIPIVLGSGIPLFPGSPTQTNFGLIHTESFSTGVVNLTYQRQ